MKKFQLWTKYDDEKDYLLHHQFDSYYEAQKYVREDISQFMCRLNVKQIHYKIVGLMDFAHGKINKANYETDSNEPE